MFNCENVFSAANELISRANGLTLNAESGERRAESGEHGPMFNLTHIYDESGLPERMLPDCGKVVVR